MISKPRLKVFIYIIFLEKLTQLIGSNLPRILDKKGRLDIGLYLAKTSGSRVDFLRRNLITASLKDCGTYPDDNDRLIIFSIVLFIKDRIYLSNFVGMGSKIQVAGLDDEIIVVKWSRVIRVKLFRK